MKIKVERAESKLDFPMLMRCTDSSDNGDVYLVAKIINPKEHKYTATLLNDGASSLWVSLHDLEPLAAGSVVTLTQ